MYKTTLFLIALCAYSFSQTPIPTPSGHPNLKLNTSLVNIGDFDGDGSDDLYGTFYEDSGSTQKYYFGVISMKKNQFILFESFSSYAGTLKPDAIGDFDGDKMVEFASGSIIYKYNATLTKKKI